MDDDDRAIGDRYWHLKEVLSPEREWIDAANASPAEREANRAVLEAIKLALTRANAEVEIADIIQIAQEAARVALMERNHDQKGTHRLKGEETTIADVLTMIPLFRWPIPAR
jgi:hypothetical protein